MEGEPRVETSTGQPPSAEALREARRAVERAVARLWSAEGRLSQWRTFYACLAAQMEIAVEWNPLVRIEMPDGSVVETGRGGWTDGKRIVVNAATLGDDDETLALVLHELEHVARLHLARQGPRNLLLWNIATDLVVNAQITGELGRRLGGGLFDPELASQTDAEETVYDRLRALGISPREYWGDLAPIGLGDAARAEMEEAVRKAALRAAALEAGCVPGHVIERLKLSGLQAPPAWARRLRRHLEEQKRHRRSWTRLHRGTAFLPYPAPGKRRDLERVGLVVDTSGSMPLCVLAQVLSEVKAAAQALGFGLIVWQADTEVYGPVIYEKASELPLEWEIQGRGGTRMGPAIEAVAKVRPPLTLWLTDGDWLDRPEMPEGRHVVLLTGCGRGLPWEDIDEVVRVI